MFTLKTIYLERKVSNENQIILLFDLASSCPCLYPMLYTMKSLRFQSISTQHADLIAIKFWYQFWFEKFSTSFCESFYSTSYDFGIIQNEIDNFIIYLESNKKINKTLIRLSNDKNINYTTIGQRIRSFLKFYGFLVDEYLASQYQPQLTRSEIQSTKENLIRYIQKKKKIINNFSKRNKSIKSEINYSFKSMTSEMIKALYTIISPDSALNPFKTKSIQFRNF